MNTKAIYRTPEGERAVLALYDAALARWPVPREELHVPTRQGDTFVIASGKASAPALVLLHGSASNAVSWIGDIAAYSRDFRVYAVDLPGEPGRSTHMRPPWNTLAFAEWLEDVLDRLHVERTSLVGLSQGGWTALRFATCQPQRVERLALLTPGGVAPARSSFIARAIVLSMLGRRGGEAINRYVLGDTPMHPEAVMFMNTIMTHFRSRIEREVLFTDQELQQLTMPVLLVVGDHDVLLQTEKIAERMKRLLPDLTVALLPGAGHALVNTAQRVIPFLQTGQSAIAAAAG